MVKANPLDRNSEWKDITCPVTGKKATERLIHSTHSLNHLGIS